MSGSSRIVQISLSPGGVPKRAVPSARVATLGLEGDVQRNREHHRGPERALCLFSVERIRALQAEGHPITPGSIGENLTSDVVIQVTRYTAPCSNITGSFRDRDYARVSQKRHPGDSRVYARVLREGGLVSGDPARILSDDEAVALTGSR